MVQPPAHSADVLPIVQLVREKVAASGYSLREFAERREIPYSTIRYYNDKRLKPLSQPPRPAVLDDLARALQVPVKDVQDAAVESLAYRQGEGASPTSEPPVLLEYDESPEAATQRIIELVRAHPGLHPVTKAHLAKQIEILAMVPLDVELEPHSRSEETAKIQAAETEKGLQRLRAGRRAPRNGT